MSLSQLSVVHFSVIVVSPVVLLIHKLLVVWHPIIIILYHIIDLHQYVTHRLFVSDVQGVVVHETESVDHTHQSLVQLKELFAEKLSLLFATTAELFQDLLAVQLTSHLL
jgi:hypothetical protein